jgi:hypothetical protein
MRIRHHAYRVVYSWTYAAGRVAAWLAAGYREGSVLERALILPAWLPFRIAFNVGFVAAAALAGEAGRRVGPRE